MPAQRPLILIFAVTLITFVVETPCNANEGVQLGLSGTVDPRISTEPPNFWNLGSASYFAQCNGIRQSQNPGDNMTLTFEGTSVSVFFISISSSSLAQITLDGEKKALLDTYQNLKSTSCYFTSWNSDALPSKNHTIIVTNSPTNPNQRYLLFQSFAFTGPDASTSLTASSTTTSSGTPSATSSLFSGTPTSDKNNGTTSPNIGLISGIVAGVVVLILIVIAVYLRRSRSRHFVPSVINNHVQVGNLGLGRNPSHHFSPLRPQSPDSYSLKTALPQSHSRRDPISRSSSQHQVHLESPGDTQRLRDSTFTESSPFNPTIETSPTHLSPSPHVYSPLLQSSSAPRD